MAGRHRISDSDRRKALAPQLVVLATIAVLVFALITGKYLGVYVVMWLLMLYSFVRIIPTRERSRLWLGGCALVIASLSLLAEVGSERRWAGSQVHEIWLTARAIICLPAAWYTFIGLRWLRTRFLASRQPPAAPADDF